MNEPSYPQRDSFFAHKFCRLMVKVCLANELGADACWLLATIVHTEDAAHYKRATTWFNGQLMTVLGISQQKTLIRIRQSCIDAGWLHYEEGGKGRAGRYWVLIPEHASGIDDRPTDEGNSGDNAIPKRHRKGKEKSESDASFTVKKTAQREAHCHPNGKHIVTQRHNHSSLTPTLGRDKPYQGVYPYPANGNRSDGDSAAVDAPDQFGEFVESEQLRDDEFLYRWLIEQGSAERSIIRWNKGEVVMGTALPSLSDCWKHIVMCAEHALACSDPLAEFQKLASSLKVGRVPFAPEVRQRADVRLQRHSGQTDTTTVFPPNSLPEETPELSENRRFIDTRGDI